MLSDLINRPAQLIQRRSSASEDDYGNEIPTETRIDILCEVQQRQRKEPGAEGETSDTEWVAFFLPGEDIRTGDVLVVDQQEYELVGDPWQARNPRTDAISHIELSVRRTVGTDDEVAS